ncbi:hypothetical protein [Aliisedimentitalea sp. MJ-SS2]|uniref:hypothetical protein n=1 Tax=Aliisedimentitalea sp. MJ-SS2 TaxID=3049795 RepID=UPI00293096F0|nr:hypothetical protein [Alisedimentitalea sp. MJ-SS2]
MVFTLCLLAGTAAAAGPYDGIYRPDYPGAESWDCRTVGMDGGALAVRDGRLVGVESNCALTNPISIRGMAATLYDAECSGEGETYSRRMMLMTTQDGIAIIEDGFTDMLVRCP